MQTSDDFELMLTRKSNEDLIIYMMNNNFLKKENICQACGQYMKLVKHNLTKDNICWRCMNSKYLLIKGGFQ
ncbi:hypothetical protein H311_02093 [Anncaliia algerae PRA109]|nr:hypothetical protein H311_02093 [Anncaliia algerae PRA109]